MSSDSTARRSWAPSGTSPTRSRPTPVSLMLREKWRPRRMPLDPRRHDPVMCLTQDGIGIPHSVQAARLCAAGATWIQLRMKDASDPMRLAEAKACVSVCRHRGVILVIDDRVDIALQSGADGVHLGSLDTGWNEERQKLGPPLLIRGTAHHSPDP